MTRLERALVAVVVLVLSVTGAAAQPDATEGAATFLSTLQRNLLRDDRPAVAAMIHYPITVRSGTLRIPFQNVSELIEGYDLVFTPGLKDAVAQTTMPGQPSRGRFTAGINPQGLLIGNGVILAEPADGGYKITRIALVLEPAAAGTATPSAPLPGATPKSSRSTPQRITIGGRARMGQASGSLEPNETRSYLVWAGQGQMFDVRVDGVRGREIIVRVYNAKTGAPVDARAAEGLRRWAGRVAIASDYRIEVVRTTPANDEPAPRYVLVVTVQ